MRNMKAILGAAAAVLALAGCDPYESGPSRGSERITRVIAFDSTFSAAVDPVAATDAGGTWTLADVRVCGAFDPDGNPIECSAKDPGEAADADPLLLQIIQVQFNTLLDGTTVQATVDDCTPAAGWTFSPAPPAGQTWNVCYNPSSATGEDGASILIYRGEDPTDPSTALLTAGTTYTISGNVRTRGGATIPVNLSIATRAQ